MRFLRFLFWLVAIGAASVWFIGFAHGFRGFTCVRVSHACTPQDLRFQWHVVLWLAPPVCLVSVWILKVSRYSRFRFQTPTRRPVAQRKRLTQEDAQPERPTACRADDCPVDEPRTPVQPESQPADPSPRHAAKNQFITLYDRPSNARPRHAAPEPDPEW